MINGQCAAGNHNLRKLLPPLSHGWSVESSSQEAKEAVRTTAAAPAPTEGNKRQLSPPVSHGWSVESSSQQEAKAETTTAATDGNKR